MDSGEAERTTHYNEPEIFAEEEEVRALLQKAEVAPAMARQILTVVRRVCERDSNARELLDTLVANANLQPDAQMSGMTDNYGVPLDDIEDARQWLAGERRAMRSRTVEGQLQLMGFENASTGGGFSAWIKKCAAGDIELVVADGMTDTANIEHAEQCDVCVYRDGQWLVDAALDHAVVPPAAVVAKVREYLAKHALAPQFAVGQQFQFFNGQHVIANGWPGTVCDARGGGVTGCVAVRLGSGKALVYGAYPDCFPAKVKDVEIVTEGEYEGTIKEVGPQFLLQECGRGRLVAHELSRFDAGPLALLDDKANIPHVGEQVAVKYDKRGRLSATRLLAVEQGARGIAR